MDISVELTADNVDKVLEELAKQVEIGLEAVGLQAEKHAINNITENGTVDTGLLRNSITHAVAGHSPEKQSYTADKGGGYGSYSGTVGTERDKAVYIGTNVEYAPYVEYGHQQYGGGGHVPAKPFLKPAVTDHIDEYKKIIETALKSE